MLASSTAGLLAPARRLNRVAYHAPIREASARQNTGRRCSAIRALRVACCLRNRRRDRSSRPAPDLTLFDRPTNAAKPSVATGLPATRINSRTIQRGRSATPNQTNRPSEEPDRGRQLRDSRRPAVCSIWCEFVRRRVVATSWVGWEQNVVVRHRWVDDRCSGRGDQWWWGCRV